ncbi:MAG: nitrilase-related carbon-nitrogen hydrolase [Thermaerobacterales bacterium]
MPPRNSQRGSRGSGGSSAVRAQPRNRRIVAVQMAFEDLPNLETIREHLMRVVLAALRERPFLIVLPAWTGLLPLHLFSGRWSLKDLETVIRRYGLALEELWIAWARELARQTGTYLVPGSVLIPSSHDRGLLHVSTLIAPDGRVMGRVTQTHVTGREAAWGLTAGVDLPVWNVDGVRVGILLGSDAWFPEAGRIMALQGAALLAAPTAVPAPYSPWHHLGGIWQQVQANQLFAVEAGMCRVAGDIPLEGRTSIMGPLEITPRGTGYFRQVKNSREAEMLAADLEFPRLSGVRREYPLADHYNFDLYRRAFPHLYLHYLGERGIPIHIGVDDEDDTLFG